MRIGAARGSYLPVLSTIVSKTTGPILELGVGFCSTPYLHWACYPTKRRLVSYENNPEYYRYARSWKSDFHEIHCITDWDTVDLSEPWNIAFVDHAPPKRRYLEVIKLRHADYVVLHDSENSSEHRYHYSRAQRFFKYRYKYTGAVPYTSVWSNKYDLKDFGIF